MSRSRLLLTLAALLALASILAACSEKDDGSTSETASADVSLEDCQADGLETFKPGTLTVATDDPAYPPYFEDNDPTNGKGFESAVAFAIADRLGFSSDQVDWVVEPFNSSYAPGPKDFDFDLNQISITPKRAEQVDFSSTYYTADQAVVALKDSDYTDVSSLADLSDAKIGVQIGTTSLDAVEASVDTTSDPLVYDNSNDVVNALKQGQVDAVVVDVPTAFYLTAAQVQDAAIVGQFAAPGGDEWGALLKKDSPLTDCVSAAVEDLSSTGELDDIQQRWMGGSAGVPTLE